MQELCSEQDAARSIQSAKGRGGARVYRSQSQQQLGQTRSLGCEACARRSATAISRNVKGRSKRIRRRDWEADVNKDCHDFRRIWLTEELTRRESPVDERRQQEVVTGTIKAHNTEMLWRGQRPTLLTPYHPGWFDQIPNWAG